MCASGEGYESRRRRGSPGSRTAGSGLTPRGLSRGQSCGPAVAFSPELDAGTNLVDELILLDPVLRPLGVKDKLLLALLAGPGDGKEVGTGPAALDDLVGDPLVGELEVPTRLPERRIDNRILNDNLLHRAILPQHQPFIARASVSASSQLVTAHAPANSAESYPLPQAEARGFRQPKGGSR